MIIEKFEEQVEKFAGEPAVVTEHGQLTYAELNGCANQLARQILKIEAAPAKNPGQPIVGLLFEHGFHMIVAVIATLKAQGIYVPLDITYPENRLAYMLENSEARLVLTNNRNLGLAEKLSKKVNNNIMVINIDTLDGSLPAGNIPRQASADKLAYILYTSGSTGKPKGVVQDHQNVCYYIRNWRHRFSISPADRLTLFSAFSHDGAGQDIFGALHSGAALYPYNILDRTNIADLSTWLNQEKITIWHSVPTLYRYFVNTLKDDSQPHFPHLRFILLGGEQIRHHDIEMFKRFFPAAVLANVYGQTESSVTAIWSVAPHEPVSQILIGQPLDNTEILIVSPDGEIVEDLGSGEIVVACPHIARGYWQDEENTAKVFLHDPDLGRLYRTGDLGRLMADGGIECMGRKDSQLKIRGFRVEVGEIETMLLRHEAVKEAVVVARESEKGDTHLYAYIVAADHWTVSALRRYLATELPEYMIPSFFIELDHMPLTPNGKVDRQQLPQPGQGRPQLGVTYVEPETTVEKEVMQVWKEVLGLDRVGINDNFFDLGGTSFDILEIMSRCHQAFKKDIPVVSIFRYPTIRAFGKYLKQAETEDIEARTAPRQTVSPASSPIAVIGQAARFPGAPHIDEFWQNLKHGLESMSFFSDGELTAAGVEEKELTRPDYVKARGVLEESRCFDAPFFSYSPAEAQNMDPQLRILHECSWEALENAGYNPDDYDGLIGLYAGNAPNDYWVALTYLNRKNSLDVVFLNTNYSTKVSYKLDLKGPSLIVQTACSTSLVAIHLACQGLIEGECDMAIAGGVSITFPDREGYLYQEGMFLSADGHCRAFDAAASGTVFGSGVGLVVLKPLDSALSAGDHIEAVIKGSAINNDGKRKVGLAAPSVEGQRAVIEAALQRAAVEPGSIGYIECHGTGTVLGDPVEIEALKLAFSSARQGTCKIGSVKTNIGHLNIAAGAASFIKAVLALKHRLIPPSLHFHTPNPAIDFDRSPFTVNTEPAEWQSDQYPLRAGVSSFGIGGTNAHVVLEEAPPQEHSSASRECQLLLLSARSESALETMSANLGNYLEQNPGVELADVAFTLQAGRRAFNYRKMLLCDSTDEAVPRLLTPALAETPETGKVNRLTAESADRPVAFLFPGQGAQYVNMGLELYRTEKIFAEEMARCFEILTPIMGRDIGEIIYPTGRPAQEINQTRFTQPLLFAFEYALARLLMAWGIKPFSMIGHSIGEYVAACLAGVFSLEHALKLVALRGQLIQQMPAGAMLSVPIAEEACKPLLGQDLSLAAVNTTARCTVSGPPGAIAAFAETLKGDGHDCRPLHTSHAFHSALMEPILAEFEKQVAGVSLNKPRIPYLSNVTGKWISLEQAADPGYWASHIRRTVRFADGLAELLREEEVILLEVGPGRSLTTFARQHQDKKPGQLVLDLIRHPQEDVSDTHYLLSRIGRLWLGGQKIDWQEFYARQRRHRLPLPTYPFEKHYYWLEGNPRQIGEQKKTQTQMQTPESRERPPVGKRADMADWFYVPAWKPSPLDGAKTETQPPRYNWLLFLDDGGLGARLCQRLRQADQQVTLVSPGHGFQDPAAGSYAIDPASSRDYGRLVAELRQQDTIPDRIVHLWAMTPKRFNGKEPGPLSYEAYDFYKERGFYSLIHLARALGSSSIDRHIEITVVTDNMQQPARNGQEVLCPGKAVILGPLKVIPQEYPHLSCRSIDIGIAAPNSNDREVQAVVEQMWSELFSGVVEPLVALRDSVRYVEYLEPTPIPPAPPKPVRLRERGVYLICGGTGGIGLELAAYLAKTVKARLILTGRSPLPQPAGWPGWLASHDAHDAVSGKIKKLKEIEALGAEVLTLGADVADENRMRQVLEEAQARFGAVNGIIQAAGVADGALIQRRTARMSEDVLAPKVKGTLVLDRLFKDTRLDFFVLCSSIASVSPNMGQVGYCAANSFLDKYALYKNNSDTTLTVSINWDNWQQVGMAAEAVKRASSTAFTVSHPLFDSGETTTDGAEVYISHLHTQHHWVLQEHKVGGKAVLPGTAYLEMARAAFEKHAGDQVIEMKDVSFQRPLIVEDGQPREVRTILKREEQGFTFSIVSPPAGAEGKEIEKWLVHAAGKIAATGAGKPVRRAIEKLSRECPQPGVVVSGQAEAAAGAIDFGPRFDALKKVHTGKNQGLGWLELPAQFAVDMDSYKLHPALLDAALHRIVRKNGSFVPFSFDRLRLRGALPIKVWSHVRIAADDPARELLKLNVTIMDEQGTELVTAENYTLRNIKDGGQPLTVPAAAENFCLQISSAGNLDHLVWRAAVRRRPGPGEIEIEVAAAGLNFKEVLLALGMVAPREEDFKFGLECAGKVAAVGEGVKDFKVGDRVMALGKSCFSRYVTLPATMAAAKPPHLSLEEAASIPLAFLTAYYSLVRLAQLQAGETVLIHAAAGGVGLSAVEIVRWLGAEVLATAGNGEKRAYLRSLGLGCVMDSRSLDFADQVMAFTRGRGVDVVLNSLSGEFIDRSLSVMAPYGRFVEIGIRDILSNRQLGLSPFQKGLSYFALQLAADLPGIGAVWQELVGHFRQGLLKPVPQRVFPAAEAAAAFRYMAEAGHIGKIVISLQERAGIDIKTAAQARVDSSLNFVPARPDPLKDGLLPAEGVDVFSRILASPFPQVAVSTVDLDRRTAYKKSRYEAQSGEPGLERTDPAAPRHARPEVGSDYAAPRSQAEKMLADIWGQHLGIDRIGLLDDFFELGGDSIKAITIRGRIQQRANIDIPLAEFFNRPTIKQLASFITGQAAAAGRLFYEIQPTDKKDYYPLSSPQQRLFILSELENIHTTYNLPVIIVVDGPLEQPRLQEVFRALIRRHQGLRTSFAWRGGEPVQVVAGAVDFQIDFPELKTGGLEPAEKEMIREAAARFVSPFDLGQPPLLRVGVIKLAAARHLLICDMHHIISDGRSMAILAREFIRLYAGEELPELRLQYKDYAAWQRQFLSSTVVKDQKKYWQANFQGTLPVLNLPLDFERPPRKSFEGENLNFTIPAPMVGRLARLEKAQGVTMNILLFALYALLIHKYSGQQDMIIGSLVAGRNHPDLEHIIGMFANFLPVRVRIDTGSTFLKFLGEVKDTVLQAYENQDYPFERLIDLLEVAADHSRNPLFDTMMIFHNELEADIQEKIGALTFKGCRFERKTSALDLKLDIFPGRTGESPELPELPCVLEYDTRLFKRESMQDLIRHFLRLTDEVAKGPKQKLIDIDVFTPAEESRLKAKREPARSVPLAVSATFTAEPIEEYIRWWGRRFHLNIESQFAPYNQVFQQILDEESLMNKNSGLNLLLVRFEDWLREADLPEQKAIKKLRQDFEYLVGILKDRQRTIPWFVGLFPVSTHLMLPAAVLNCLEELTERWQQAVAAVTNVYAVDFRRLGALYRVDEVFDPIADKEGHVPFGREFLAAVGTAAARRVCALYNPPFKVIALDCDNTLWRGICGEDGALGVRVEGPYAELQKFMLARYNEGFLLVLCSKNNESDVWEVFEKNSGMVLKQEHVVAWKINWRPKSENLRELAEELNVGLDSFIFIDDSGVECGEVMANAPEVLSLQLPEAASDMVRFLSHVWAFDKVVVTAEDRGRSRMVRAERRRQAEERESVSLSDFLAGLDLKVGLNEMKAAQVGRVAQLTQRTNQFNLSIRRRSEEELLRLREESGVRCWVVEVSDRFGDYGLVGVLITKPDSQSLLIDTFLLSCRVLGRGVEDAVLLGLRRYGEEQGLKFLSADYYATARNRPVLDFMRRCFNQEAEIEGGIRFRQEVCGIADSLPFVAFYYLEEIDRAESVDKAADTGSPLPVAAAGEPAVGEGHWQIDDDQMERQFHGNHLLPLKNHTARLLLGLPSLRMDETPTVSAVYRAPGTELERRLLVIWQNILKVESIGMDTTFFELGGNSLKAVGLISELHRQFNVELRLRDIFEHKTIAKLAALIGRSEQRLFSSLKFAEEKEYYVLSPAQKRLYILSQFDNIQTTYNLPLVLTIEGKLARTRLQEIFQALIHRHQGLRTSFALRQGELIQIVHDRQEARAFEIEYSQDETGTKNSLDRKISGFVRPFDLAQSPLFRVGIVEIAEDRHLLMVDMHHIISDGTSLDIMIREFVRLYAGHELSALGFQYRDYAEWQNSPARGKVLKEQEEYWLDVFPSEPPVVNLPCDFARPAVQAFGGKVLRFEMGEAETGALKQLVKQAESTLFMVLLAVLNVLLMKLTGQEDLVVGTPVAGRRHADLEQIIGVFINTLVLRNFPAPAKSFNAFLRELTAGVLKAFENQAYPFEDLVDKVVVNRDLSRNPLFDVLFILHNEFLPVGEAGTGLEGLRLESYRYDKRVTQFDLTFICFDRADHLAFEVEYCTGLFKAESIERFIGYFKRIAASVLTDPGIELAGIDIMSEEEKNRVLLEFNRTDSEYPRDRTIHRLFEECAAKNPHRLAVVGVDLRSPRLRHSQQLSYKELNVSSERLARRLRQKGIGAHVIVGLMVERSVQMMTGLLGILKSEGAYLPLDPDYPDVRLKYILEKSGTSLLLTHGHLKDKCKNLAFGGDVIDMTDEDLYRRSLSGRRRVGPAAGMSAGAPAYVIYTSGSTGNPKGVVVCHRNGLNFIKGMREKIAFSAGKVMLALTTISFDIFFLETLLPVTVGLKVVVGDESQQRDPRLLSEAIVRHGVDMVQATPSRLQLLLESGDGLRCLDRVEVLLVGGEALPANLFEQVREQFGGRVYNMYGPTETTIWSALKDLSHSQPAAITIGSPIANTRVYILDRDRAAQPVGVAGELLIGGDGLADGYLDNVELTVEKFIESPFGAGERLYRTGDLARWLPGGELEFLGRLDHQVKIRGFRIELAEIEEQLTHFEPIKEAVVVSKTDPEGHKYLCAYLVPGPLMAETKLEVEVLRDYLARKLPHYMIPAYFELLAKIPLTPNGKVDRKALPEPGAFRLTPTVTYVEPGSPLEKTVAAIWSAELGLERVGINDNFFDLGGNSLDVVKVNSRLREALGMSVPVVSQFRYRTVGSLAQYLNREAADGLVREDRTEALQRGERDKLRRLQMRKRRSL